MLFSRKQGKKSCLNFSPQPEGGSGGPVSSDERASSDYETKVPLDQRVYSQYFVQDSDVDAGGGFLMDTKIPVKEVRMDPEIKGERKRKLCRSNDGVRCKIC